MDNIYKIVIKGKLSEVIETIKRIKTDYISIKVNENEFILCKYGDNYE